MLQTFDADPSRDDRRRAEKHEAGLHKRHPELLEGAAAEGAPLRLGALGERDGQILERRTAPRGKNEVEEVAETATHPERYPERALRARTTSCTIGNTDSSITIPTTRWM